ncbi:Pherophorin [Haematococcus lacustris]
MHTQRREPRVGLCIGPPFVDSSLAHRAFPWCTCSDYAIGSSPYSLSLFSTTTSATNITATFVVNALDTPARPSTCFNILQDNGVEKIELASSDVCRPSLVATTVAGAPKSWSWQSFGPGRQVMKLVNLFLDFDTADGVEVTITLNRSGLCPTWNTFFRGAYAIFNSDMKCCPRGDLAQP